MTEVAGFDVAAMDGNKGTGEQTLNALESRIQQTGNAIVRRVFQEQWALIDKQLTEAYAQAAAPGACGAMVTTRSRWRCCAILMSLLRKPSSGSSATATPMKEEVVPLHKVSYDRCYGALDVPAAANTRPG